MKKSLLKTVSAEPSGVIVTNESQLTAIINRAVALALASAVPAAKEKEDLLDIDGVSKFLGLSRYTVLGYTSAGTIPHFKRPGSKKLYFSKAAIEKWVKGNAK